MKRVILLALAVLLTGCGSSYRSLIKEDSLADLHMAKVATMSRPNHTVMAPTGGGKREAAKLAVHQLDSTGNDRVVVFIHGVFADHMTWRFVAGDLARDHDVWLVDLPGCGDSEALSTRDEDSYTISDQSRRTLEALRVCMKGHEDAKISFVGHSLGGAVVVRMLSDDVLRVEFKDILSRVDRLVLIQPLDVALSRTSPVYKEIAEASSMKIGLASVSGVLKERVGKATRNSVMDPARALREEADKRIEILESRSKREALQAMLERAVPWKRPDLRPDWDKIEPLEDAYTNVDRPALIIAGLRDEALPPSMSFKLAMQLPKALLVPLKGVMHSPHIEAHERVTNLIREFITTGDVRRAAVHLHGDRTINP